MPTYVNNSFTSRGTTLSIGSGTPVTIMQVKQFSFSGVAAKYEDATNLNSPSVGAAVLEEAIPGTVSPGTATISGQFLPTDAGQTALLTAYDAQTLASFSLQLPKAPGQTTTGNLFAFSAYVQDMPLPDTLDVGKPITFKVTLKLNSIITITPGS